MYFGYPISDFRFRDFYIFYSNVVVTTSIYVFEISYIIIISYINILHNNYLYQNPDIGYIISYKYCIVTHIYNYLRI
jgi:hypothetical protein